MPKGEHAILTAIAQHPEGATLEQLSVITGYKRSSRNTYLQRLRSRDYVEKLGDQILVTQAGLDALGSDFEPLPTGRALLEHWRTELPEGERRVLDVVVAAYPDTVEREAIDEETGYKRSSRNTYLQRLSSRKLVDTAGQGEVRAADILFD